MIRIENCPHCPDGHDDPNRKPWAAFVGGEKDGDGQPIGLRVQPTNGSHVAESDAEWLRTIIRSAKAKFKETHHEQTQETPSQDV